MIKLYKKILFLLTVIAIGLVLSSCTNPFSKVTVNSCLDNNNVTLPEVTGFINNSSVNNKLASSLFLYADTFQDVVDQSENDLKIKYTIEKIKDSGGLFASYRITMKLCDIYENSEMLVATAIINGNNDVSVEKVNDYSWINAASSMSSAELVKSTLLLQKLGFNWKNSELYKPMEEQFVLDKYVKLYELLTKTELDTSIVKINEESANDELYKKALLLDLCYYSNYMKHEYSKLNDYSLTYMNSTLMKTIERDAYANQDNYISSEEFISILKTLYQATSVNSFYDDIKNVDTSLILNDIELQGTYLERQDAATLLCKLLESSSQYQYYISLSDSSNLYVSVKDSDNLYVNKAITYSLMDFYGNSTVFAPEELVSYSECFDIARKYCYERLASWDDNERKTLTNADSLISLACITKYFNYKSNYERATISEVINDRNYDWFFSQENTGEFSSINCMPSIATMATHWYYPESTVTVEEMRNTSDSTSGWNGYYLRNGLKIYNVPYSVQKVNLDNILEAIDNGKIILVQYSDRPFNVSGHCYVIYGYRRYETPFNTSYTFIVNDSDSLSNRAEVFGRKRGNGDELNSKFSLWSIQRFVSNMTVIG